MTSAIEHLEGLANSALGISALTVVPAQPDVLDTNRTPAFISTRPIPVVRVVAEPWTVQAYGDPFDRTWRRAPAPTAVRRRRWNPLSPCARSGVRICSAEAKPDVVRRLSQLRADRPSLLQLRNRGLRSK